MEALSIEQEKDFNIVRISKHGQDVAILQLTREFDSDGQFYYQISNLVICDSFLEEDGKNRVISLIANRLAANTREDIVIQVENSGRLLFVTPKKPQAFSRYYTPDSKEL